MELSVLSCLILQRDIPVKEYIISILTVSEIKKDVNADGKIREFFEKPKQYSDK